jgi:hypothetical protein
VRSSPEVPGSQQRASHLADGSVALLRMRQRSFNQIGDISGDAPSPVYQESA